MAKRVAPSRAGRPSKGPRDLFVTRVPVEDGAQVRELAEEHDLSYSDAVGELIRIGLRHRSELRCRATARQEELPLKAS
jgi:hypothetical protein